MKKSYRIRMSNLPFRPPVMRAPIAMPPPVAVDLNNNQLQDEKDIIAKDPYGLRALVAALATQPNPQVRPLTLILKSFRKSYPSSWRISLHTL